MPRILLVSDTPDAFQELAAALQEEERTDLLWAHDGQTALERLAGAQPDLVVVDETVSGTGGLEWIRHIMSVNAFVQTAVVSALPSDAFHEASEGLGILMQLPPAPDRDQARRLTDTLDRLPELS